MIDSNFVLGNAAAPPDYPIVYCSDGFCSLTGDTDQWYQGFVKGEEVLFFIKYSQPNIIEIVPLTTVTR